MQNLFTLLLRKSLVHDFDQLREAKARGISPVSSVSKLLWVAGMWLVVRILRLSDLDSTAQTCRTHGGSTILHEVFPVDHDRACSFRAIRTELGEPLAESHSRQNHFIPHRRKSSNATSL